MLEKGVNKMFYKKFTLVLITLVFMLSLSVVSATDTNSTDDMISDDADDEPPLGSSTILSLNESATDFDDGEYVLNGSDVTTFYNSGLDYTVTLSKNNQPVSNAFVLINLNGESFNKTTDSAGKILIPLKLNAGHYEIISSYGNLTTLKNNINILPLIESGDITTTYKAPTNYYATFKNSDGTPLAHAEVKFSVNGKSYTKKTDSKGVASIGINLKVGDYTIVAIHPDGYKVSNKIIIKHSIETSNLNKHYKSSKKFTATFYGSNGKVLANKYVKFKFAGRTYFKKTNDNGVAKLKISSKVGSYKIISINPSTGEKVTNKIKVSHTLSAKGMTVYTGKYSTFKVKLYKNDKLVKNVKVYVYINCKKKTLKTDSDGVANVKFKLSMGTYYFKSKDPYTGLILKTKIIVKLTSIKADNVFAKENTTGEFKATLLNKKGKVAKKTNMQFKINGVKYKIKTNSKGVATYKFKLPEGTYDIECKDLQSGFTLKKKIVVLKVGESKLYDNYGVSEDGKTIMAIGRASASGELSKYGYNFYQAEFLRICPYCSSDELYWGIFWANSESDDVGVFPVTGHKEGGSAEGHIFCAHCDCDWSVFGHNHGGVGGDLTIVMSPIKVTKETAYLLKSGTFVYP